MTKTKPAGAAVWEAFLEVAKEGLSRHVLETWLRPVQCRGLADGVATLEVRDQFARDWLHDPYRSDRHL